jgi:hypothetical protein
MDWGAQGSLESCTSQDMWIDRIMRIPNCTGLTQGTAAGPRGSAY